MHSTGDPAGTAVVGTGGVGVRRELLERIMSLREGGVRLVEKFSVEAILSNIEKQQIEVVELFSKYLKEGFNLLEFVRFFLNIVGHRPVENLYLAMGLIDLFREITMQTMRDRVVLKDITDYMCDRILKNNSPFNKIEAKYIPFPKFVAPNPHRKPFLQHPPLVYGQTDHQTHKLCQKSIKTDSSKHSRAIIKSQFCLDLRKVFILDSLTESISLYDDNCVLQKKISPVLSKLKKEVIILSFAFSKRQYRIGAVLKDFSLKFWDHFNDFDYEKSISTTSVCQHLQTGIYFLEYFNSWITTDKTGVLHFWNLLEERPHRNMHCKYAANITDICEISALNLVVVVQECKRASRLLEQVEQGGLSEATVVLYNFYSGHIVTEIDLVGQRIPHTVLYSETYQVLFMSGLQKKLRVYELHPNFMDASLKGELVGHENLITSFTLVRDTPMVVSADDKGKVKLWDFRTFTCLQTVDFSDKTVITNLLDMVEIGKIGVFGSRVNYIEFEDKMEIIKKRSETVALRVEGLDFDQQLMEMYVFAGKTLRVLDLANGQLKHIFSFAHPNQHDYTLFRYFSCLKRFLLANSRGEVAVFSPQTGQQEATLKESHEGAVSFIEFDELNKLYVTVGFDSKVLVHRSSDGSLLRELKNNFQGREVSCIELSVYHNILLLGSNSASQLYCWNYEYGKLIGEIRLPNNETPVSLTIINGYALALVATSRSRLLLFRLVLSNSDLLIELLDCVQLTRPILNVMVDLKLKGRAKSTNCEACTVIVSCQSGYLVEYDLTHYIQAQIFRPHCKEKSNYNPYREGKENFVNELQKQKHYVLEVQDTNSGSILGEGKEMGTQLNTISVFRLMKMQETLKVVVGNERRLKIWNEKNQLLCDYNISYSLPYRWQLLPTSLAYTTQKIYYGIKIIQTIVQKYEHDISIGQARNLELRELFTRIDPNSLNNKHKMITEPDQPQQRRQEGKPILLLQEEYSRKDLNFDLVKRFNFTEIGGPTLKELDNIKKLELLQREWKIKESKEQKEKDLLLRNIEAKAKKNEEKEHVQLLLVRHKKYSQEPRQEHESIASLARKLNAIEEHPTHPLPSHEDKRMNATLSKNHTRNSPYALTHSYTQAPTSTTSNTNPTHNTSHNTTSHKNLNSTQYNLSNSKTDMQVTQNSRWLTPHSPKRSFEDYYACKMKEESDKPYGFREILTEMNGRVKNVKKQRVRRKLPEPTPP